MIKKMRFKFVMINMGIVTIMLCVIFGLVFYFTRANLERESLEMMRSVAGQPYEPALPYEPDENVRLPYFTVQFAPQKGFLANDRGYFDLSDDEFLDRLLEQALASPKSFGVIEECNLRYYREDALPNRYLVFSDISSERATLDHLLRTCLVLSVLSFFAFLIVSILLSKWAVRPVETAWQQQRQFVADASHELKTPLAVIMTNAELAQGPECAEGDRQRFLDGILAMAGQMKGLTEELLELARADSFIPQAKLATFELGRALSEAVLPFEPVFFEAGLTLVTELQGELVMSGEEARIRQVLEILLDNARKYSKPHGTTWVTLKRSGRGMCLLTVANQGDEILPEDLRNLFKRFYRADRARSRNGSFGLGLAIAESIVTQHRGRLWAESQNGLNSFYVELPLLLQHRLFTQFS